jgi:GNAT superfamily N-acetyltransferase
MSTVTRAGDTFTYPVDLAEDEGRSLWMPSGGHTIVATDEAGRVLGTAKFGANQMGPGSHVATGSFMVAPLARRRGVGRKLGDAAVEWAKARGFRSIQFNAVVSTNLVALGLWQSLGFDIVGTVPGAFAHPTLGDVSLHVMYRHL